MREKTPGDSPPSNVAALWNAARAGSFSPGAKLALGTIGCDLKGPVQEPMDGRAKQPMHAPAHDVEQVEGTMAKREPLTEKEAAELFSHVDDAGVVDLDQDAAGGGDAKRARRAKYDPLSSEDPSGSKTGNAISRTAILSILLVIAIIVGMQIAYGINRRLNTANLSKTADVETVEHAMESGVEWGNGFTQFPEDYTVIEASEETGVIEVSVVDTDSEDELELLSNSQIQSSALATNALLNDKVTRVVYNVYVLVDEDGEMQHDSFFGMIDAQGTRKAMLTFIWTKSEADSSSSIDWELQILGMDEATTEAIQEQVNSVSSLANDTTVTQQELEDEQAEQELEQSEHGSDVFLGHSEDELLTEEQEDDTFDLSFLTGDEDEDEEAEESEEAEDSSAE